MKNEKWLEWNNVWKQRRLKRRKKNENEKQWKMKVNHIKWKKCKKWKIKDEKWKMKNEKP